jgi:glycosyltransferase involved in cell wall biosynthesis
VHLPKDFITCSLMPSEIVCDIIVPVWNRLALTKRCLESISQKTVLPYRLILVDNGSGEETGKYLESLGKSPGWRGIMIRNKENLGYIKAVNQGLKVSTAPHACLLNNDIVVTRGWLGRMIEFSRAHPEAGLVNPQQNHDPGKPMPGDLEIFARSQVLSRGMWEELDHCTGGCLLIKREVIEKVGYLDEAFGDGYWEDNDYSRRAQEAGFRCLRLLDTYVWHDVGASFEQTAGRKEKERANEALYYGKWGRPLRIIYPVNEGVDLRRARFQQILQTAHALARQGCEVDLIVGKNKVGTSAEVLFYYGLWPHENLRLHCLPMLRREDGHLLRISWNGVFLWGCWLKIRELMRKRSYDAVFTRHLYPAAFLLAFKNYFRLPLVFEAHEIFFLTTARKGKAEKIKKEENKVYPRMDGIVCISYGLAEQLREIFPLQRPVEVIPDGVNLGFYSGPPRRPDNKKIIYVGQLYPWKGAGTLVEAMKYIDEGNLHVVGGSAERIRELKETASRLGIEDRIVFHGQVPPEEVRNHLAGAEVGVLPLTRELISASFTSPLKLFEYMAARVPIVASDLPSTREILTDGVNALLVQPHNSRALADAIRKLLENRELAQELSRKAYEDVFSFTWEKRAERLIRFIRALKDEKS